MDGAHGASEKFAIGNSNFEVEGGEQHLSIMFKRNGSASSVNDSDIYRFARARNESSCKWNYNF